MSIVKKRLTKLGEQYSWSQRIGVEAFFSPSNGPCDFLLHHSWPDETKYL